MTLHLLDWIFHFLHIAVIALNLLGWIPKKTRRLNLYCLILTFLSWFALAPWFGLGYCFLTDWHWQIKMELGQQNIPYSYIKLILDNLLLSDLDADIVYYGTFIVFAIAFSCSLYVNIIKRPTLK